MLPQHCWGYKRLAAAGPQNPTSQPAEWPTSGSGWPGLARTPLDEVIVGILPIRLYRGIFCFLALSSYLWTRHIFFPQHLLASCVTTKVWSRSCSQGIPLSLLQVRKLSMIWELQNTGENNLLRMDYNWQRPYLYLPHLCVHWWRTTSITFSEYCHLGSKFAFHNKING